MTDVRLRVGGADQAGWAGARIVSRLDSLCASFLLADPNRREGEAAWFARPDDACAVLDGDETLLTGFVDSVAARGSGRDRGMTVRGRSAASDIVDCSPADFAAISKATAAKIAERIAAPFGVSVALAAGVAPGDPFPTFAVHPGETAWNAMSRALRARGLIAVSLADGSIEVRRAGATPAAGRIVEEENVVAFQAAFSRVGRYGSYAVVGQDERGIPVTGRATDRGARAARVLTIDAPECRSAASCNARTRWEAAWRAGRSRSVRVTVPEWRQAGGELWVIDRVVQVALPALGIDGEMLISGVDLRVGKLPFLGDHADGTRAVLELVPVGAFSLPDGAAVDLGEIAT